MKGIIRIGDKTTGGSTALSASTDRWFSAIGVARQSGPVSCPIPVHGRTAGAS